MLNEHRFCLYEINWSLSPQFIYYKTIQHTKILQNGIKTYSIYPRLRKEGRNNPPWKLWLTSQLLGGRFDTPQTSLAQQILHRALLVAVIVRMYGKKNVFNNFLHFRLTLLLKKNTRQRLRTESVKHYAQTWSPRFLYESPPLLYDACRLETWESHKTSIKQQG